MIVDVVQAHIRNIPDNAHVGDKIPVKGFAHIYGIRDDRVETTSGGQRHFIPGERTVTVTVDLEHPA